MEQCQLIKLAQLGNKEAAKRLTDAGVLVSCPFCGYDKPEFGASWVYCPKCNAYGAPKSYYKAGMLAWNTRAPILSENELKKMEEIL